MLSDLSKLYNTDCFQLAKSIIFKSHLVAQAINNILLEQGIEVIADSPETWKYYKNLSGEYHFTDLPKISITSVDTLEVIEFTKENMLIHKATAREYAYGTEYYESLVLSNPEKEPLIRGILNPIDKTFAISAKESTILHYNGSLIEEAESNLIVELQYFISMCWSRWNTVDYRFTHDLYLAMIKTIIDLWLPAEIKSIRLSNCKTNRVHSFHIQMFLASHGRLDRYYKYLTDRQRLYLYRNIIFLNNHAGKQSTFKDLVKVLLTERSYPLVGHRIYHNTEAMPESLNSIAEFIQYPINTQRNFGYTRSFTPREILDKEDLLASGNADIKEDYVSLIEEKVSNAPFDDLPTKVLESNVVDNQTLGIRTLNEMLLDHWMYMSVNNRYLAVTSFTHPTTGEKTIVSGRDAFVLFIYAYCKAREITLEDIPTLNAMLVRRLTVPSATFMREVCEYDVVSDSDIATMRVGVTDVDSIVSIDSFYSTIKSYHTRLQEHYLQWIVEHNKKKRAQLKAAAMRLYALVPCVFYANTTYADWFSIKGLQFDGVSRYSYERLAVELFRNATGISLNTTLTLTQIHRNTVELMSQLSSYSIQFITNVTESVVIKSPFPEVMVGDCPVSVGALYYSPVPLVSVRDCLFRYSLSARINHSTWDDLKVKTEVRGSAKMNIGMHMRAKMTDNRKSFVPLPVTGIRGAVFNFS